MSHESVTEVIVVGAGVGGLCAARALHRAGVEVKLLEKSRGLGGRAATRRLHGVRVDHGAQYFTARDPRWQAQVDAWLADGALQVWTHGFHTLSARGLEAPTEGQRHPRYAFAEGMNTLGKLLGEGLEVEHSAKVTALTRSAAGWTLTLEDGRVEHARRVLLNLPAPQALALAEPSLRVETRAALRAVAFAPCLALLAGFHESPPVWQGIQVEDGDSPLAWLACDTSKPGRQGAAESAVTVLVLHATPEFSEHHLEAPEAALSQLLSVAASLGFAEPLWTQLQRWRYAKVTRPLDVPFLREDPTLFFCGDWCGGAKLENAYLSGLEVAGALQRA